MRRGTQGDGDNTGLSLDIRTKEGFILRHSRESQMPRTSSPRSSLDSAHGLSQSKPHDLYRRSSLGYPPCNPSSTALPRLMAQVCPSSSVRPWSSVEPWRKHGPAMQSRAGYHTNLASSPSLATYKPVSQSVSSCACGVPSASWGYSEVPEYGRHWS